MEAGGSSCTGQPLSPSSFHFRYDTHSGFLRLKTPDVAISVLQRAAKQGFKVLVVTLDTITIGWRPHDIDRVYFPFAHGTGCAVGTTDPVFRRIHGYGDDNTACASDLETSHVEYPYDPDALDKRAADGDPKILARMKVGGEWSREMNSGVHRTWKDIAFLREHWKGPIVLKGILSVAVRSVWSVTCST